MALAKSIGDVMDKEGVRGQINVFAQPFPFGFQEVAEDLHLWKHQGVRSDHQSFVEFLNSNTGDGGVDLIVLGTCQYECVHSIRQFPFLFIELIWHTKFTVLA